MFMLIISATFHRQLLLEVFDPGVGLLEGVPGDGGVLQVLLTDGQPLPEYPDLCCPHTGTQGPHSGFSINQHSPWIDGDNFDSDDILFVGDEAVPREAVHLDCDGLVGLSDQPELPHLAGVNVAVLGVGAVSLKMNIVAWAELTPDSRHYR